jgi:DNA-binding transcriptional LysR family regulator
MAERRLQVFHAVARNLSFTQAAEQLCMTQQAVTFLVRQLEEHLNVRLLRRNRGRLELTPAGELALDYASRILALSEELESRVGDMTGEIGGTLLLGASPTVAEFYLPQILAEFRVIYPRVQAQMAVSYSETILNRVANNTIDLGLVSSRNVQPNLAGGSLEVICQHELMLICSTMHPMASAKQVAACDVACERLICREPGSSTRKGTDNYFLSNGLPPEDLNVIMELGSPESIKAVVESGLGVSILPRVAIAKELRLGTLCALQLVPKLERNLFVALPESPYRSQLVGTFAEFATSRMRAMAVTR